MTGEGPPATTGAAPARVATALLAPFVPFTVGFLAKAATPDSGAFDPLLVGGLFLIPSLAGVMVRVVRSWRVAGWTVVAVALAAAAIVVIGLSESVNEDCLQVPEAVWLAVPATLLAAAVAVAAGVTAVIVQPSGSWLRLVLGLLAGGLATVLALGAALLVWSVVFPLMPSLPNCEVMHIL